MIKNIAVYSATNFIRQGLSFHRHSFLYTNGCRGNSGHPSSSHHQNIFYNIAAPPATAASPPAISQSGDIIAGAAPLVAAVLAELEVAVLVLELELEVEDETAPAHRECQ